MELRFYLHLENERMLDVSHIECYPDELQCSVVIFQAIEKSWNRVVRFNFNTKIQSLEKNKRV